MFAPQAQQVFAPEAQEEGSQTCNVWNTQHQNSALKTRRDALALLQSADIDALDPRRFTSGYLLMAASRLTKEFPNQLLEDERFMKNLMTAILMTLVMTALLGLAYPLAVTGLARIIFPDQAEGQLIKQEDGTVIGSALIGQPFSAPGYFHPRPSAAGVAGYDALASSGSNLGPTNRKLIERVMADVRRLQSENPGQPVPVDLVTTSGSGLDPHISPAAAEFQVPRVARERGMSEEEVRSLVAAHTTTRQFGFLGEAGVNVLKLNLDLDQKKPMATRSGSLTAAAP